MQDEEIQNSCFGDRYGLGGNRRLFGGYVPWQRAGGCDPVCYDSGFWLRDLRSGQPGKLKTFAAVKKTIDKCFLTWYYVEASSVSSAFE